MGRLATNCRLNDIGMVVRNTTGCPCTQHELGRMLECKHLGLLDFGAVWFLPSPIECKTCGGRVFGFLDADMQPMRPRGPEAPEARPVGVSEVAHG